VTADNPAARVDLDAAERETLGQRLMLTMTCNHGSDHFGTGAVCETCFANVQRVGRIVERILADRLAPLLAERDNLSSALAAANDKRRILRTAVTAARQERDEAQAALVAVERSVGMQGYRFCSRECHGEALTIVRAALADPEAS
jgi:hypothetical protein